MPGKMTEKKRLERQREFIERVSAMPEHTNDDYSHVEYVNDKTKVKIFCKKCNSFYLQAPKYQKIGQSCPMCAEEYVKNSKKGDWQHFIEESIKRFGDVFEFPNVEQEYVNSHSKITVICKKCGTVNIRTACTHITNGGCSGCNMIKFNERNAYTYDRLVSVLSGNTDEIVPFEGVKYVELKRKHDKVECVCPKHGKYMITLSRLLQNKTVECPTCKKAVASTGRGLISNIRERIEAIVGNNLIFDENEYVNSSTPMKFVCRVCGHSFMRPANTILSGCSRHACPECGKRKASLEKTKTIEDFIADAKKVYGDNTYDFSETKYIQSSQPVTIKCNTCGRYFTKEANSFLQGNGCPYHNVNSSKCEKEIVQFIRDLGIEEIHTNDRTIIKPDELDIYIPSHNLAFEFDGIFWHSECLKNKDYHISKTMRCEEKSVRLIHVFEDEWKQKREIWESMIRNLFGKCKKRIFARQCEIRDVTPKDACDFLQKNHLQGKCGSTYRYGLYYKNELVSLMTFGHSRHFIGNGKTEFELLRFCNKLNTTVAGGASRLLKYFIKIHNPNEIVSFADRRWSNGELYNILGFELYNKSKPNYYYVIGEQRKNRFLYRKSVLVSKYGCPESMSERDFCRQQKWWRIYDCGCLCFKWSKKNNVKL